MSLSGTDFSAYLNFQEQADQYRYTLAQTMNELQMELISPKRVSGSEGKTHVVGNEHWDEFDDFVHQPIPFSKSIKSALIALFSLLIWSFSAVALLNITAKTLTANSVYFSTNVMPIKTNK